MTSALIGYTGFVGGNIHRQSDFDDVYNSTNIADIANKKYDVVVSAANRAEMWRINQEPEKDMAEIEEYMQHIQSVRAKKFVLISTVGVYKHPNGANEDTEIETAGLSPYGAHRYELEQFCQSKFDTTVVRLPGLFGDGLKKNVIYDLLHDNNVDRIHKDGVYQYYNLANIWKDIGIALEHGLPLVNLATPPVSTQEVAQHAFGIDFTNTPTDVTPAFWDMHSKYASMYGGEGDYLYTKQQVLNDIKSFVLKEKSSQ